MRTLSKSKILAFRQCTKRLWLEVHRPDLFDASGETESRLQAGHQVGAVARRLYDPIGSGTLIDVQSEGFDEAFSRSRALLNSSRPIFEAGFAAKGVVTFADIMLPVGDGPEKCWRMVEVKSSTSVKDYHRADVAIQAFVASAAGARLDSIVLAHIDSSWVYPGAADYRGLLVESDLTEEAFGRHDEVSHWIDEAQTVVCHRGEPPIKTAQHCSDPFECGFWDYCRSQEPQADHPVEWLPRLRSNAVKDLLHSHPIIDMREMPDELLNDIQRRVKAHTLSGEPFFDQAGAAAELASFKLSAFYLDFETIQFAVPIWKGTRPYQQIPFQFSLHRLCDGAQLEHSEFLDLSGDDPSQKFAEALVAACGAIGAIFVYNAAFERSRIKELAEQLPQLANELHAINDRVVDLLPIVRQHYYHPSQQGSWSIKKVLPAIAPELSYDALDGVKDGGMAMVAYLEAIHPQTLYSRKREIRDQLLKYCALDTFALVRVWQRLTA